MSNTPPQCARRTIAWAERYCRTEKGKAPKDCPSLHYKKIGDAIICGSAPEELDFARNASIQEAVSHAGRDGDPDKLLPAKPRIVEIVEFAKRMSYRKIGLIFCGGSRKEAAVVQEILETNSFEVVSVMCKVGRLPKSAYGLQPIDHLNTNKAVESACNPKFQALIANEAGVDFNVLLNLCVGHDSLAIKYLEAPTTVFAVKDRLLGHNPLAAIYLYDTYYRFLKKPL